MNIYLKWIKGNESQLIYFPLLNLEISQKENYFAKARLVIDALTSLPPAGTEGVIMQENEEILFKGCLVGSPIAIEGSFGEIELIAKPLDFLDKISVIQKRNRIHPYWDELWVAPEEHNNFQEIQDVRTASLFCDPRTGDLSFSDWFEGGDTMNIKENFFQKSLKIRLIRAPLKSCSVNVNVYWVQETGGISNLSPQIRKAFPHHKMSTYTKKALQENWPKARKWLGRSGLWILKSDLQSVSPSLSLYSIYSPGVPLEKESGDFKIYHAEQFWFKPTLWVRWQARQKRKETLSFTLFHSFQSIFPGEGEQKHLEFSLQNINPDPKIYTWEPDYFYTKGTKAIYKNKIFICHSDHNSSFSFEENQHSWTFKKYFHTALGLPARASFFLTDRGLRAAEHAMERAKVALAESARCLEVSFEATWDNLKNVTTDTSLTLSDQRLPGGKIKGKVVKCVLIAKGDTGERIVQVTLLCAAGTGHLDRVEFYPTSLYSSNDYSDDTYQIQKNQICKTPSGLSYFINDPHDKPKDIMAGPLVRGLQLINGPQDQEALMKRHAYKSAAVLKKALLEHSTRLRVFFKDLRTKERLDHLIAIQMAAPWSAPKQFAVERV